MLKPVVNMQLRRLMARMLQLDLNDTRVMARDLYIAEFNDHVSAWSVYYEIQIPLIE
jgi:hypothetical protein